MIDPLHPWNRVILNQTRMTWKEYGGTLNFVVPYEFLENHAPEKYATCYTSKSFIVICEAADFFFTFMWVDVSLSPANVSTLSLTSFSTALSLCLLIGNGWASVLNTNWVNGRTFVSPNSRYKYFRVSPRKKVSILFFFGAGTDVTSSRDEYPPVLTFVWASKASKIFHPQSLYLSQKKFKSQSNTSASKKSHKCKRSGSPSVIRYVGLLWSLSLIRHLFLSAVWQGL